MSQTLNATAPLSPRSVATELCPMTLYQRKQNWRGGASPRIMPRPDYPDGRAIARHAVVYAFRFTLQ